MATAFHLTYLRNVREERGHQEEDGGAGVAGYARGFVHAEVGLSEYRESCLLCFNETWLKETIDNSTQQVTGFSDPIRLDRDSQIMGKKQVGVCVICTT